MLILWYLNDDLNANFLSHPLNSQIKGFSPECEYLWRFKSEFRETNLLLSELKAQLGRTASTFMAVYLLWKLMNQRLLTFGRLLHQIPHKLIFSYIFISLFIDELKRLCVCTQNNNWLYLQYFQYLHDQSIAIAIYYVIDLIVNELRGENVRKDQFVWDWCHRFAWLSL